MSANIVSDKRRAQARKHASRVHVCSCGKVCRGNGGWSMHHKACVASRDGTKRCTECKEVKPLAAFNKETATAGPRSQCRACLNAKNNIYRAKNEARIIERDARYRKLHAAEFAERLRRYKKETPDRFKARRTVTKALAAGALQKEPCFICGDGSAPQAHHSSYAEDMRLAVTWLCDAHHRQLHREAREAYGH